VSVVDNVLLIHQVDAKVVILYDLFADSRAPISAPLPLLLRGFPRSSTTSQFSGRDSESSDGNIVSSHEAVTYADTWIFLVPDLVCDVANKLLWKFNLDLEVSFLFILVSMPNLVHFRAMNNLISICPYFIIINKFCRFQKKKKPYFVGNFCQ
jgi:hypothetical protein